MTSRPPPRSRGIRYRSDGGYRTWAVSAVMLAVSVLWGVLVASVTALFLAGSTGSRTTLLVASVTGLSVATAGAVLALTYLSHRLLSTRRLRFIGACYGVGAGVACGAIAASAPGMPLPVAAAVAAAVSIVTARRFMARRDNDRQVRDTFLGSDPRTADERVEVAESAVADTPEGTLESWTARRNLAGALLDGSLVSAPQLARVLDLLRDLLADVERGAVPADAALPAMNALARDLVDAYDAQWDSAGPAPGHKAALDLGLALARRAENAPYILSDVCMAYASYAFALMTHAHSETEMRRHLSAAEHWFHQAHEAVPPGDIRRFIVETLRARVLTAPSDSDAIDESIERLSTRVPLPVAMRVPRFSRCQRRLLLAELMIRRAGATRPGSPQWTADVAKARRLLRSGWVSPPLLRAEESRVKAMLARELDDERWYNLPLGRSSDVHTAWPHGWRRHTALDHARRHFDQVLARGIPQQALAAADLWADIALTAGDKDQAAEAFWQRSMLAPLAAMTWSTVQDRGDALRASRYEFADAGRCLTENGRLWDAAAVLDLGRAVQLRQLMGIDDAMLRSWLESVGRPDLHHRLELAWADLARSHRSQLAGSADVPMFRVTFDGIEHRLSGATAEQRAWGEVRRCLDEIRALPDAMNPFRPLSPDDFVQVADGGHVVHLAAGYALHVSSTGNIRAVPLPEVTSDAVEDWSAAYRRLLDLPIELRRRGFRDLTARMGAALEPLTDALPRGAHVTLVPVGALGLLPVHVAFLPDANCHLCDFVQIRHAPSAALALRALRNASDLDAHAATVLAVAAPYAPNQPRLPTAAAEATAVHRIHGGSGRLLTHATRSAAMAGLAATTAWHFACHGQADPVSPLDSRLMLADVPLRLRDMLTRDPLPGSRRLAVLSACESAVPGADLPDEAMGFPAVLMHLGVCGVVATLWPVDDAAAGYAAVGFHRRWRAGMPPDAALAASVRALRTATVAELRAEFPASRLDAPDGYRPYASVEHWGAFTYTGC